MPNEHTAYATMFVYDGTIVSDGKRDNFRLKRTEKPTQNKPKEAIDNILSPSKVMHVQCIWRASDCI